jgi:hypothetical protein
MCCLETNDEYRGSARGILLDVLRKTTKIISEWRLLDPGIEQV